MTEQSNHPARRVFTVSAWSLPVIVAGVGSASTAASAQVCTTVQYAPVINVRPAVAPINYVLRVLDQKGLPIPGLTILGVIGDGTAGGFGRFGDSATASAITDANGNAVFSVDFRSTVPVGSYRNFIFTVPGCGTVTMRMNAV